MRTLIFFLFFPICISAQLTKDFTVTLKVDSVKPGEKFYLAYKNTGIPDSPEMTDSLEMKDDKIIFKGKIGEPGLATIYRYTYTKTDTAFYTKLVNDIPMPEEDKQEALDFF